MKPVVYLLCGLGGSGKSTYAQKLAEQGLQKFSLDEYVYDIYGRGITKLPESMYLEHYRAAKVVLDQRLITAINNDQSAVLDYGFWRRDSRDYYKQLIEEHGGEWKLIYLKASPELLMQRLAERNKRTDANAFPVSVAKLQEYIQRFEEPHGEGEEVVRQ